MASVAFGWVRDCRILPVDRQPSDDLLPYSWMVALDESRGESVEKQEAVVDGAVPGKPAPETGDLARGRRRGERKNPLGDLLHGAWYVLKG